MKTRQAKNPQSPKLAERLQQAATAKQRLLTAKHLRKNGITYCVSRPPQPGLYEIDNPALDLWQVEPGCTPSRQSFEIATDVYSKLIVGYRFRTPTSAATLTVGTSGCGKSHTMSAIAATHEAARAEQERADSACFVYAHSWIDRIGMKLPLDDEYVDRFWPLQASDIEIAFLYYFAAQAHSSTQGRRVFAGLATGAPHILAKWYPPSFWQHLRSLSIEKELRALPQPEIVPSLDEVTERLRKRYDHNYLYKWYRDSEGQLTWSAFMKGAPLGKFNRRLAPKASADSTS